MHVVTHEGNGVGEQGNMETQAAPAVANAREGRQQGEVGPRAGVEARSDDSDGPIPEIDSGPESEMG